MMINREHNADTGGCKGTAEPADPLLPQIDHLQPDQLRRRAADDRDDARMLTGRASACVVAMLLSDAERCEARAMELELSRGMPAPAVPRAIQSAA